MKLKQSTVTLVAAITFAVMTALLIVAVMMSARSSGDVDRATRDREEQKALSAELAAASEFLTTEVREFAVTTDDEHLHQYWKEIDETKTRDRVVARLERLGVSERELGFI